MCAHHCTMTTQQLGFSVLSAPLASLDRRALSQAWYSALHFASSQARETFVKLDPAAMERTAAKSGPANEAPAQRNVRAALVPRSAAPPRSGAIENDRRLVRSPLARKIERAFLHPNRRLQRATFSIGTDASRVHVSLQQSGNGLRLVAVCAPPHRTEVARALEQARYALATRGIALGVVISEAQDVH